MMGKWVSAKELAQQEKAAKSGSHRDYQALVRTQIRNHDKNKKGK
jgi:hypothetical protein